MPSLDGSRVLVLGGSGVLGGLIATELTTRGARTALAGRSRSRLRERAAQLRNAPTLVGDLVAPDAAERLVGEAVEALGGLDGLVCAAGEVAFGRFADLEDSVLERLVASNLTGPLRAVRSALSQLDDGGHIAVITGAVVDTPTAGLAAYSGVKAGLSAALAAVAREARRHGIQVLDARPPHTDTGLVDRAIAGSAPTLPAGLDPRDVARIIVEGIEAGARQLPPAAFVAE